MTFLERILETKRREVEQLKQRSITPSVTARSPGRFAEAIRAGSHLAIISEIKKASPSKGLIQPNFHPVQIARAYEQAGASAISILTDVSFFQGSIQYLADVRAQTSLPLLRKDFIIDRVQIDEACRAGADVILLIVAALDKQVLRELSAYAKELGLDVLIEVHSEDELEPALAAEPSVIGVNNRNLHNFEVSLDTTLRLMNLIPTDIPAIAESGVKTSADAALLAAAGVDGLLIGESLMRLADDDERRAQLQTYAVPKIGRTVSGAAR